MTAPMASASAASRDSVAAARRRGRGGGTGSPATVTASRQPIFGSHPFAASMLRSNSSSRPGATLKACSNRRERANAFRSRAPLNPSPLLRRWSRNWSLEQIHASRSLAYSMMVRSSEARPFAEPDPLSTMTIEPSSTRSIRRVFTQTPFPMYFTHSALRVARPPPSQSVCNPPTTYSLGRNATTSYFFARHGS